MAEVGAEERRVLVAVDESEESMHALSWCLNNIVSDKFRDTLLLLYVKPPRAVSTALDGTAYLFSSEVMLAIERYGNEVAEFVMEKAKRLCSELGDVKVETRIENGDARDVICQMTDKLGADLLVMGSHGYGLIKRTFLGSVSNHCAQNAKCPVMIVKKPKSTPNGH
ncbi:universal stress protein A-like protein isoform X2 [Rhodamnia argentea]|uniref:Universal stress protein A-like protein isoform X2 n=1 Tax=Rhodamnia argentea TaxID=178133 RepID=A0A8B8QLI2_9MYRT|nr:universal stress protein A-like protein isoform X2 [Rhodamnia argentea]